ncbi:MAG TPA: hypothetical protein VFY58_06670 [Nocardioides sp.]|nr:hypothetical protein [Nocardioides sp.]
MTLVFVGVVLTRLLLPLLIPRFPLPAIVACLVADAADQTVFQSFGFDPPGYQGYDKAMDVYYLAIAYLATLRNWTSLGAFEVGRFLYFFRVIGVLAFELSQTRPLLLVFPNTFEYFFIAYEGVRSRWNPLRFAVTWWIGVAAVIWVFVKLPQEYWIHVAQLDVTDFLAERSWAPPALAAILVVLALGLWYVVRPRLRSADWPPRFAADALPEAIDTAAEQAAWRARTRLVSWITFEKVALVGLLSVLFAQILPGVRSTDVQMFFGTTVLVVANSFIALVAARRARSVESLTVTFAVRLVMNSGLVLLSDRLLGTSGGDVQVGNALFFMFLLSLLITLHDRYQPVHAYREQHPETV